MSRFRLPNKRLSGAEADDNASSSFYVTLPYTISLAHLLPPRPPRLFIGSQSIPTCLAACGDLYPDPGPSTMRMRGTPTSFLMPEPLPSLNRRGPTFRFSLNKQSDATAAVGDLSPSIIDMDIFSQLLEMDDEEDREFSKSIVWNYFDQAENTFEKMDNALASKDLPELSTLGHFLKGSSAAVGVIKVRDSCECMQHYGKKHDEDGISELTEQVAMEKITVTLKDVKVQYKEAEKALKNFYTEDVEEEADTDEAKEKKEKEEEKEEAEKKEE